jgi:hypothetical protein
VTEEVAVDDADAPAPRRPWWRSLVRPALLVVVSVVVGFVIVGFVGAVDWGAVASAFARLSWWQVVPLVLVLLVRQVLNGVPLSQFVPGLTLSRSVQNDLAANLLGTVTPPPGDVVIRVAMFKSWGVTVLDGMAGVTLNVLTFYAVRLVMPSIGLVLLAIVGAESGNVGLAVVFLVLAVGIIAVLLLVLAQERWAVLLGRLGAQVAQRLRREADPDQWSRTVVDFRKRVSAGLPAKLARSLAALALMVVADATILTLALRFTGVGGDQLPLLFVIGTFCTAYPLTVMPLFGFGVLDAALLATFTEVAGLEAEASIVAALAIWRAVTLLGPLALGALVTLNWRRRTRTG